MPSKIVLSYRRSDSDVITGRIRDALANHYGEDAVFMDIDSIPVGFDYREKIKDALVENKVMIAVIGPKWLGGRGKSARINKDNDPVRIELETAFQQGVPIIPVLVSSATMPETADLPQSLQRLCDINAGIVDGGRDFHQHMDRLIHGVDQILETSESPQSKQTSRTEAAAHSEEVSSRKWIPIALGTAACLFVTAVGLWTYRWISPYMKSTNSGQPVAQTAAPKPLATAVSPSPAIAPPKFSSAACKPEKASFYDDFHKTDLGWNITISDQIHYADGQLVLIPAADKPKIANYLSLRYENVTICAHIKSPSQIKALDSGAAAGVIFWAGDNDNYYLAQIRPDGSYSIYRRIAGTWVTLIPRTKSDQIKSEPSAINEVTVIIVGDFAALFVNNAKLQEFRGQSPKGGGAFGLYAQSEKTAPNEWRFLDFAVMDNGKSKPPTLLPAPSGPAIGECQPIKTTDFQDRFQKADPGWGIADPTNSYVDGQLAIKLDGEGHFRTLLYRPLIFKNATVCVTVKFPPAISNFDTTTAGGLAFWGAADYETYYVAEIYPNGTFAVYRRVEGNWATVIPRTISDTIKKGTGAVNELQVVVNDDKGWLYINGMQVGEFRGQPPQTGGATGIYAQSGDQQASDWRFLNIAVVENQ